MFFDDDTPSAAAPANPMQDTQEATQDTQQTMPAMTMPDASPAALLDDDSISVSMASSDSPLGKFEKEHHEMLEEREKKSIASQKQATAAAKAEIEELSQARKAKCDARAKLNKDTEAQLVADTARVQGEGNEWAQAASLLDFQRKYGENDTARIKALIIELKQK
eukprot:TRINITY_DN438_c0_g1_i1.p2 TRINITY_DN438_c0_g1~~TRINITY_DN438_c0_g1_i1.p2  ORF type:complete len:165 (-),score=51.57 TRINITY_DN438_c0_g1_i1:41-535(-)